MTSIYMDGDSICWYDGICWYGPGSAYSAGKCTRPAHKKTKVGPPRGYAWIVALAHERTVARSELIDRVEAALKKYQGTPISIRSLASIIVTAAPVLLERRRG